MNFERYVKTYIDIVDSHNDIILHRHEIVWMLPNHGEINLVETRTRNLFIPEEEEYESEITLTDEMLRKACENCIDDNDETYNRLKHDLFFKTDR